MHMTYHCFEAELAVRGFSLAHVFVLQVRSLLYLSINGSSNQDVSAMDFRLTSELLTSNTFGVAPRAL